MKGKDSRSQRKQFFALLHKSSGQRTEEDALSMSNHLMEQFHFFRQLPTKAVSKLAMAMVPRHIHANEPIYTEGSYPRTVSFVYSGVVAVHSKSATSDHGKVSHSQHSKLQRQYGPELHRLSAGDLCGVDGVLEMVDRIPKSQLSTSSHKKRHHVSLDMLPDTGQHNESFIAHRDVATVIEIDLSAFLTHLLPRSKNLCWQPGRCIHILSLAPSLRTKEDLCIVQSFIKQVAFFQQLSRPNQLALCAVMRISHFPYGENVFAEGDKGHEFYVIVKGHASVHVLSAGTPHDDEDESNAPTLSPMAEKYQDDEYDKIYGRAVADVVEGDSFGEKALQNDKPRNASVRCESEYMKLCVISREQYTKIIAPKSKSIVANIKSASAVLNKDPSQRTKNDINILLKLVQPLAFFKQLPEEQKILILKCCTGFNLDSENLLFRQGDAGVSMYVVLRGFVNVYIRNAEQSNDSTELSNADSRCLGTCVANLVVGDSFGELALMRGEPRNATITAGIDGAQLLVIPKENYDKIAKNTNIVYNISHQLDILHKPTEKRMPGDVDELLSFVNQLAFFKQLPTACVRALCRHMSHGHVEAGVPVMVQGDLNVNGFYIILNGSVSVHLLENQTEPTASALNEMGLSLAGPVDDQVNKDFDDEYNTYFPHGDVHPSTYDHLEVLIGKCVGMLTSGDTFGDMAMRKGKEVQALRRGATIIARENTEILVINSHLFNTWLKDRQLNFEPALCRRLLMKPPQDRTDKDVQMLSKLLGSIDFFHELNHAMLVGLCQRVKLKSFQMNEYVFKQGTSGDSMFVIIDGSVNIHIKQKTTWDSDSEEEGGEQDDLENGVQKVKKLQRSKRNTAIVATKIWSKMKNSPSSSKAGKANDIRVLQKLLSRKLKKNKSGEEVSAYGKVVGSLGTGDSVGEQSLLHKNSKRSASVVVSSPNCDCIEIKKFDFDLIIASHADEIDFHAHSTHKAIKKATVNGTSLRGDKRLFEQVCKPIPDFRKLDKISKSEILRLVDAKYYKQDDVIYKRGNLADKVFYIVSGKVEISEYNVAENNSSVLGIVDEHSQFGAIEVLEEVNRSMTATAKTDTICVFLDALTYQYLWARLHDNGYAKCIEFMKTSDIFSNSSIHDFCCIQAFVSRHTFPRGAVISRKGNKDDLYILFEGGCDVQICTTQSDHEHQNDPNSNGFGNRMQNSQLSIRFGEAYTSRKTVLPKKKVVVCSVGPGHLFFSSNMSSESYSLVSSTNSVFYSFSRQTVDRYPNVLANVRKIIKRQRSWIKKRNEEVGKTSTVLKKLNDNAVRELFESKSIEKIEARSLSPTKKSLDAPGTVEDTMQSVSLNSTRSTLNDNSILNKGDSGFYQENSVTLTYTPHLSFHERPAAKQKWKMNIAQMVQARSSKTFAAPLRSNLSRAAKNSDAGKSHMLSRVGYKQQNYYTQKPPQKISAKESLPIPGVPVRPGTKSSRSKFSPANRSRKINSSSPGEAVFMTEDTLHSKFSVLPEIMQTARILKRQAFGAKKGATLLHGLRRRNMMRKQKLNLSVASRIMNGSTRRQYVRTFFGHQTSRRSSPVRSNRGMLVDKTSSELFDSSNFNNGWAGRFG